MTCPKCNDTACLPQWTPLGDWYCVLCNHCDSHQPGPVAPDLLGERCETCGGTGRAVLTVGTVLPDYIEHECQDCRGWGWVPYESTPPDDADTYAPLSAD